MSRRVLALAGILGLSCLAVGVADQVMVLVPMSWGDASWEVAYAGQMSATMGLSLFGAVVVGAVGLLRPAKLGTRILGVLLAVGGVLMMFVGVVVLTDLPLVWEAARSAGSATQAAGFKIVTVKAILLSAVYAFGSIGAGTILLRARLSTTTRG